MYPKFKHRMNYSILGTDKQTNNNNKKKHHLFLNFSIRYKVSIICSHFNRLSEAPPRRVKSYDRGHDVISFHICSRGVSPPSAAEALHMQTEKH